MPPGNWGYFKVPGCWPGIGDYMQKDCQTVYSHPSWANRNLGSITAAWYRREFQVPENWASRRIALRLEYLNSYAVVYVDGQRAEGFGGPVFPPGSEYLLGLLDLGLAVGVGKGHLDAGFGFLDGLNLGAGIHIDAALFEEPCQLF